MIHVYQKLFTGTGCVTSQKTAVITSNLKFTHVHMAFVVVGNLRNKTTNSYESPHTLHTVSEIFQGQSNIKCLLSNGRGQH